jgi:hypothetical protein
MFHTFDTLAALLDPSPLKLGQFEDEWAWQFDSWNRAPADTPAAIETHPWIAKHFDWVREAARTWRDAVRGHASCTATSP